MSDELWIVVEGCGAYSDRTEVPVAWFPTREEAERWCDTKGTRREGGCYESRQGEPCAESCDRLHLATWDDGDGYGSDWSIARVERGKWPFPLPVAGASA